MDMISPAARQLWKSWYKEQEETPYFTNAQQGKGIREVAQAVQDAGLGMNQRRRDRGMQPRPVRAVVIGFPNVGKSALINRLLGRRVVESARRAGVTRQLRWVRISDQIELLDAPGVIPAQLRNQDKALKLAICDDIGEASYDNQRVAVALVELLKDLDNSAEDGLLLESPLKTRYELDPTPFTGEDYLHALADYRHQGNVERTARQLLNDFRTGLLGAIPLELPPA
jgi:ribosome biogenesis GTPase A